MIDKELQNQKIAGAVYENVDGDISGQGLQDVLTDTLGVIADNVNENERRIVLTDEKVKAHSSSIEANAEAVIMKGNKIKNTMI